MTTSPRPAPSTQPRAPRDVAIVGGGIAGLAAAFELSRRGVSFVLLERAPRAGGVIFSEEVDGFTIDGGPDALLIQKPEAIALCREIGLGDRLVSTKPPRLAYIQRGGRLHALPAASVLGIPTRIGPELAQVIDDRSVSIRKFLIVPIGFVCDHTEILFDIDVQAAAVARESGATIRRTESLNLSPTFIAALEDLVRGML